MGICSCSPSPKLILIVRLAIYVVILICSFVIFAPVAINESKHASQCLLYGERSNNLLVFGSKSMCDYSIAIAVLFCLLYPLIMIIFTLLTLIGKLKGLLFNFSELPFLITVILETVILLLVMTSACTIGVGLKTVCNSLTKGAGECSLAFVYQLDSPGAKDFFYGDFAAAEGGAWTAFIMWLTQVVIGLLLLWRNGRLPCLPGGSRPASTPNQEDGTKY